MIGLADGDLVDKGQPVFKIIDNLSPVYMYTTIAKADFAEGFWDEPGTLQVFWNNFEFSIVPGAELVDNGENIEGLFMLKNFPEQIIHRRKVSIDVTAGAWADYWCLSRLLSIKMSNPAFTW